MITIAAAWRPHTERPQQLPTTAVIAMTDGEGGFFLVSGVYTFTVHRDAWWDEDTSKVLATTEFYWLPEDELIAALPKMERAG
jgi:hypothetical protein